MILQPSVQQHGNVVVDTQFPWRTTRPYCKDAWCSRSKMLLIGHENKVNLIMKRLDGMPLNRFAMSCPSVPIAA